MEQKQDSTSNLRDRQAASIADQSQERVARARAAKQLSPRFNSRHSSIMDYEAQQIQQPQRDSSSPLRKSQQVLPPLDLTTNVFQTLPSGAGQPSNQPGDYGQAQRQALQQQVKERRERVAELRKMHARQIEDAKNIFPNNNTRSTRSLKRNSSGDSRSRSRSNSNIARRDTSFERSGPGIIRTTSPMHTTDPHGMTHVTGGQDPQVMARHLTMGTQLTSTGSLLQNQNKDLDKYLQPNSEASYRPHQDTGISPPLRNSNPTILTIAGTKTSPLRTVTTTQHNVNRKNQQPQSVVTDLALAGAYPTLFQSQSQVSSVKPSSYREGGDRHKKAHRNTSKEQVGVRENYNQISQPHLPTIASVASNLTPPTSTQENKNYTSKYSLRLEEDNRQLKTRIEVIQGERERLLDEIHQAKLKMHDKTNESERLAEAVKIQRSRDQNLDLQEEALNKQKQLNRQLQLDIVNQREVRQEADSLVKIKQSEKHKVRHKKEDLVESVQEKEAELKQIEQDKVLLMERIYQTDREIELTKQQTVADAVIVRKINEEVHNLQRQRDDAQEQFQIKNDSYNRIVAELSRERSNLNSRHRNHQQLLTCQVLVNTISKAVQDRKRYGLNRFTQYCTFDSKCHKSLSKFAWAMYRCAQYQERIAIRKWHQRTYEPIQTFQQTHALAGQTSDLKLIQKVYLKWRQTQYGKLEKSEQRLIACKRMAAIKNRDIELDLLRYVRIWRDNTFGRNRQLKALLFTVLRQTSNQKRQAFLMWRHKTQFIRHQIRYSFFAYQMTKKLMLQQTFLQMRCVLVKQRRLRLLKLKNLWMAWKKQSRKRNYLKKSLLVTQGFLRQADVNTLKACFDAFRQNKEEEKCKLMQEQLHGIVDPHIDQTQATIKQDSHLQLFKAKSRAIECLDRLAKSKLCGFFIKWKNFTQTKGVTIDKNLRQMLIRRFNSTMLEAFNRWRQGHYHSAKIEVKASTIYWTDQNKLQQKENIVLKSEIQEDEARYDRCKQTSIKRSIKIGQLRLLMRGWLKWKDLLAFEKQKEKSLAFIDAYVKKQLKRQTFQKYKQVIDDQKVYDKGLERAEFYKQTVEARRKREIFNAMCAFVNNFTKQKTYSSILMQKMSHWLKRKAFRTWIFKQNEIKTVEYEVQTAEHHETVNILAHELRAHEDELNEKVCAVKGLEERTQNACKAQLLRNMERKRTARIQWAFEKWKTTKDYDNEREKLMKRTIDHWQHYRFYRLKSAWQYWLFRCQVEATNKCINECVVQQEKKVVEINEQRERHQEACVQTAKEHAEADLQVELASAKVGNAFSIIMNKGDSNFYQKRTRLVWEHWVLHTRKVKRFLHLVCKIQQKTYWCKGMRAIKAHGTEEYEARAKSLKMRKVAHSYWYKIVGIYISKWKETALKQYTSEIRAVDQETANMIQAHIEQKAKIAQADLVKADKIHDDIYKRMWYLKLKGLAKQNKLAKTQQREYKESIWPVHQKKYLLKWAARTILTNKLRDRVKRVQHAQKLLLLRRTYAAIRMYGHNQTHLIKRLADYAEKINHNHKQCSVQTLKNYVSSQTLWRDRQKLHGTHHLVKILVKSYHHNKSSNFSDFRQLVRDKINKDGRLKAIIGRQFSRLYRKPFYRWKDNASFKTVAYDVNTQGPMATKLLIVKQNFDAHKLFMSEQGYEEEQIEAEATDANQIANAHLARTLARMKLQSEYDDGYLIPECFKRWRQFVGLRKLMKWHVNNVENRMHDQRADMSHAFNTWKQQSADKLISLWGTLREQHKLRDVDNQQKLFELAARSMQTEARLAQIGQQRDELLVKYAKAKKLGLVLGRDNHNKAKEKIVAKLNDHAAHSKKDYFEFTLSKNIEMIGKLKDKINAFEAGNERTAIENEELRQFSLDGYNMAKNAQAISDERERLHVDLADKSNTIRRLLDDNEVLVQKLNMAEQRADVQHQLLNAAQKQQNTTNNF